MLPTIEAAIDANAGRGDRAAAVRGRGGGRASSSGSTRSRATSGSSAERSTSRRCGPPTCPCSSSRCTAPGSGWIPQAARRRPDPGHRDPRRAQPVLRRHQPRADPAERRRGAGADRRRRLRPRAAARRRRGPRGRGGRAGDVPPPARGHGPAHVLPGRAPRDARPGRRVGEQHVDGRDARAPLRDRDARGPGGLQVHRAEDDRDGRDAGRRGVRRVRVRDAPARARRHLRRPVPARPVPARARAWPGPGVGGDGRVPRARRAVVLPPHRRPLRPALVRRRQAARAGRPARVAARDPRRRGDRADPVARHRRRRQVVPRRRVVAARAGLRAPSRWSASTRRPPSPSCATCSSSPANSWCAANDRAASRRQAVGPRADLGAHRPLLRQGHRGRGGPAGCRSSGTSARTRAC